MKTGIELIAEERKEQIEKHGWSLAHDQDYGNGQLIEAAYFCVELAHNKESGWNKERHPWPEGWDKHFENKIRSKSIIQQYVVAGAFFMAENDRLKSDTWQRQIESIAFRIDRLQLTK